MHIEADILENMADWMRNRPDIPQGWIYLGDGKERYLLGQPGKRNMLVFGVNPSSAVPGEENDDPTIRKVRKLTASAGYGGWIMANLYPAVTPHPAELSGEADPVLLDRNISVLKALQRAYRIDAVWAAWGDAIDTRFYLGDVLYDIQEALDGDFEWYRCGSLTRNGNPRHPLYRRGDEDFAWFPVADYAANWRYAGACDAFVIPVRGGDCDQQIISKK